MKSMKKSYAKSVSILIVICLLLQTFQGTVAKASWVADIDNGYDNAYPVLNQNISNKVGYQNPQTVECNGILYLTWVENNSSGKQQVRVCQYDGTTFTFIDENGENGLNFDPAQGTIYDVAIEKSNGVVYVSWVEFNASNPNGNFSHIKRYDGTPGAWTSVDGGTAYGIRYNTTVSGTDYYCAEKFEMIDFNNTLYAVWTEHKNGASNYNIVLAKLNGTVWETIKPQLNTKTAATEPNLEVYNNELYISFEEGTDTYTDALMELRVKKYSGSGTTVTDVTADLPLEYDDSIACNHNAKLVTDGTSLYAVWNEKNTAGARQIRAKKYDGSSWSSIDGGDVAGLNYNTSQNAFNSSVLCFGGDIYVSWNESNSTQYSQLRIKKYNPDSNTWSFVDDNELTAGAGFSYGLNLYPLENSVSTSSLASYNSTLYLLWVEGGKLYVKKQDNAWTIASDAANLSDLQVSEGSLYPDFDPNSMNYVTLVDNSVTSVTLTPTVYESNATITVNDVPVSSTQTSGSIPLEVGSNDVAVKVFSHRGVLIKKYVVKFIRYTSEGTILLSPTMDGSLYGSDSYSTDASNYVGYDGSSLSHSFEKFDYSFLQGGTITDAKFKIYIDDPAYGNPPISGTATYDFYYSEDDSWDEATATLPAKAGDIATGLTMTTAIANANEYYTFSQEAIKTAVIASTDKVITTVFEGKSSTTGTFSYCSDDALTNKPILELTYVQAPSSKKAITSFNLEGLTPGVTGTVNETDKKVSLTVPYGTDVTALVPTITHTGSSVSPNSGVAQDFTNPVTYQVTAADGTTQDYTVTVTVAKNTAKAITGFKFGGLTPNVTGTVNETNKTVSLTVPYGTDVTALVPTITQTGSSVSPNSGVVQDFTNPVTYTVTAEDGTTQDYTVTVTVAKNPAKAITSFNFGGLTPGVAGTVNETNKTVSLTVPYGTNVTSLVPTILYSGGASIAPNSGASQDFTNPVTYTVTAEDETIQDYTVTVTVAKNPEKAITSFNFGGLTPGVAGTINETNKTVSLIVPYGTDVTNLVPTITHTGSSVSPNSGVAQDFTSLVTYQVTAADGTTQDYAVTVTIAKNTAKAITGFKFGGLTPNVTGTVNETNKTVSLTVPYGTDVTALVPTIIQTGSSVSPNSGVAQDFTNPVTYTVTAEDGTTQDYTVTVTVAKNPAKAITSFNFGGLTPGVAGTINETNKTVSLTVPYGTNVTSLVPTILYSGGASIAPNSGASQDFTNPVTYTVTAEDGTTQDYIVTVTIQSNSVPSQSNTPTTPTTTTTTTTSEKVVVDVKKGDSEGTVSQITIQRETDTEGKKTDTVTYQEEKAVETIAKLKDAGEKVARIMIPDTKDEVQKTNVSIPSKSVGVLADGAIDLKIETENASIQIPNDALKTVQENLKDNLYFNLVPVKKEEEKKEIITRTKMELGAINKVEQGNITVLGRPVEIETNMPSSKVEIILPLTGINLPTDSVNRETFFNQLGVFIEHSDGEKEYVKGEIVEYKTGVYGIKFPITKFSMFTIVKMDKEPSSCNITKVTVPTKARISSTTIKATVSNVTSKLTLKLTVSKNASWSLYADKGCKKKIKNKKVTLSVGTNTYYIKVTAKDGAKKVYKLSIKRKEASKKVIIIATKYDFQDAVAGGVLASQLEGEVLRTGTSDDDAIKMVKYITKNYKVTDQIYIIGLGKAVNGTLKKRLQKEGYQKITNIGGEDKFETAARIAKKIKLSKNRKVVLISGDVEPADAKAIEKACGKKGYPILFVKKEKLTVYTIEALKEILPKEVYVIGSKSDISDSVISELKNTVNISEDKIIRISKGKSIQ